MSTSAGIVNSSYFSFLDQEGLTANPNSYCDLSGCTESEDRHLKARELRKECFQNIIELIESVRTKICWPGDWEGDLHHLVGEAAKNACNNASRNIHGQEFVSIKVETHDDRLVIVMTNSTDQDELDLSPHPIPVSWEEATTSGRGIAMIIDLIEKTFHGIAEWIVTAKERVDLVLRLNFAPLN